MFHNIYFTLSGLHNNNKIDLKLLLKYLYNNTKNARNNMCKFKFY